MGDVQIDDIEIPEAYEHLSKLVDRKLKAGLTAGAMCLDICVQATAGGKPSLNKARHFLSGLASLSRERNPKLATIEKNEENNGKYERQYRDVSHFWAAIIYQALTTQDEWTWNDFWLDMVEDREKFLEFLAISHSIYLDFASALSNEIRAPWVVPSDLDLPKAVVTYQINDFREEYLRNYKSLTARGY
ncbi:hypothetical protein GCM10011315_02640 [Roseovarius pacificus]|nr:hypothetical protein GCM10011315_02640 [Roseovarius pacificus]